MREQRRRKSSARRRLARIPQRERWEARAAIKVGELCESYMEAAHAGMVLTRFRVPKRSSTVAIDVGRVSRHIKPLIGSTLAQDLTRADVQRMVDQITQGRTRGVHKTKQRGKAIVKGGGGTAARVSSLLVETARYAPRDRVCSSSELRALGNGLDEKAAELPDAVTALLLIALTGLRREEAVGLRWSEVDIPGHCLRLSATKTGKSVRPIGSPAISLPQGLKRKSPIWVFPNETSADPDRADQPGACSADLKKQIATLFNIAGLDDARSHDLRRTFASAAADEGYSDATIAALVGHSQRSVTARHYIRRPDDALIAAANRTAQRISSVMRSRDAQVLPLAPPSHYA